MKGLDVEEMQRKDGMYVCALCEKEIKRGPDLRRHLLTHDEELNPRMWVCTGVPMHRAGEYGVTPEDVLRYVKEKKSMPYEGEMMVGGCGRAFSGCRSDSLARHLKNSRGKCIGSHLAEWLVGNKIRRALREAEGGSGGIERRERYPQTR